MQDASRDRLTSALEWGLCAIMVASPLMLGAVRAGERALFEGACFVLGLLWLVRVVRRGPAAAPGRLVAVGLLGLLAIALLQLAPLPRSIVTALNPISATVLERTSPPETIVALESSLTGRTPEATRAARTLSLDAPASASALRTGCAFVVLFLVALTVAAARGAPRLFATLAAVACFQSLYGIVVLLSGHDRIFHIPKNPKFLDVATGTFVNPNHFAGFVAATLPLTIALTIDRWRRRRPTRDGRRPRLAALSDPQNARTLLLALLGVIALTGLFVSLSRAGIVLGVVAISLTIAAATRRRGLGQRAAIVVLVLAAALVPLGQLGLDRIGSQFDTTSEALFEQGRAVVWRDSVEMVVAAPLTGVGFGAFAAGYPLFRSPEIRRFFAHAHNDPLQLVVEGGLPAAAFGLLPAVVLLAACVGALSGRKGLFGVGAAVGCICLTLQALIDFPLHLPAIGGLAAVLAGTVIGLQPVEGRRLRLVPPGRPAERRTPRLWALIALLLAAIGVSAAVDVSAARRPLEVPERALALIEIERERGRDSSEFEHGVAAFQRQLASRPLDSKTRSAYAAAALGISRRIDETAVARFHALAAADLAPVTGSVVRRSAAVLASSGELELALEMVSRIFRYDPGEGAEVLFRVAPGGLDPVEAGALPRDVEAWLAWSRELRRQGRHEDSAMWIDRAASEWPTDPRVLHLAAGAALRRGDWGRLDELFGSIGPLPRTREAAYARIMRARWLAHGGDADAALAEIDDALRSAPESASLLANAGDAFWQLTRPDDARRAWTRALYQTPRDASAARARLHASLARLEEIHGKPAQALRHWRSVLDLRPDDGEAAARVDALLGRSVGAALAAPSR